MKKFRFSLEAVLRVRRNDEESRRRELALAQAGRDRTLALLSTRERGLRRAAVEHSRTRVGAINLAREGWYLGVWNGLNLGIRQAKQELALQEEALEAARLRAVEASRARLALEKLQEKQLQEHLFQANHEEQALLDDLGQRAVSVFSLAAAPVSAHGPAAGAAAAEEGR